MQNYAFAANKISRIMQLKARDTGMVVFLFNEQSLPKLQLDHSSLQKYSF